MTFFYTYFDSNKTITKPIKKSAAIDKWRSYSLITTQLTDQPAKTESIKN